jgi:very-short-patch-repair endonuclease
MDEEIKLAKTLETNYNCRIIINEEENKCLFCLKDIGKILNIKNINDKIFKDKILIKIKTNGGNQNIGFINYNNLLKIFSKTRKPEIIELGNNLNINLTNKIYTCIETETIKCILDAFKREQMIQQYKVKQYFIDLYFPKYKLAIECDEKMHNRILKKENDISRENDIKIEIKDIYFIRYEPDKKDFNIFNVINKIYKYIIKR